MNDDLFPSGPWVGFYNYSPKEKHRMDLNLAFAGGKVAGDGNDDVGCFVIKGQYDPAARECSWTKTYVGGHDVSYRGFREGKGIWGTWEISLFAHGGFHIWPNQPGDGSAQAAEAEKEKAAEAIATAILPAKI